MQIPAENYDSSILFGTTNDKVLVLMGPSSGFLQSTDWRCLHTNTCRARLFVYSLIYSSEDSSTSGNLDINITTKEPQLNH